MSQAATTYRIGMATTDITPPVGFGLAGLSARPEPSTSVYHPLRATAVAIDDGQTEFLLIGLDWLGLYDHAPRARAAITVLTGVPAERIAMIGSHTHCGPALRPIDIERGGTIDHDYLDDAIHRMARCGVQARDRREPARLRTSTGRCGFGASRRRINAQGQAEFKLHRTGPHDHAVPVIAIESLSGTLRGVLFSYACHPTARFGRELGGDYAGFAVTEIERRFPGVAACFLQGCGGDQKPAPMDPAADDFAVHSVDEVRQRGRELADGATAALSASERQLVEGPLRTAQRVLTLRTDLPDPAQVAQAKASESPYMRAWGEMYEPMLRSGAAIDNAVPMEVQMLAFGRSLAMPMVAAELTVEYGHRWRRDLATSFDFVFPVAYSNDIVGYVPVRRQIPEGGYEVVDSNRYYKRPGPYVATTEDQIHDAIADMLLRR